MTSQVELRLCNNNRAKRSSSFSRRNGYVLSSAAPEGRHDLLPLSQALSSQRRPPVSTHVSYRPRVLEVSPVLGLHPGGEEVVAEGDAMTRCRCGHPKSQHLSDMPHVYWKIQQVGRCRMRLYHGTDCLCSYYRPTRRKPR